MRPRLKLGKQEKLRRSLLFKNIYDRGHRICGPHLTFCFLPNQLKISRLGLSVSKKRFRLSAQRHYIQRRLREAFRRNKMHFLPGFDIVISARGLRRGKNLFADMQDEFLALAKKAKLLKGKK